MLHNHKHIAKVSSKKPKKPKHYVVLVASVLFPFTTMPQVFEIFNNQSADNVSLLTYLLYVVFSFIFLGYGIKERLIPIIVLQSLWLVMYSLVIAGILIYS